MTITNENHTATDAAVRPSVAFHDSFVDWQSIIAGTLIALAISILLITFGTSIGLSVTSATSNDSASVTTISLAGAVWFALVHFHAIGAGSYIAGRLRPRAARLDNDEVTFRDGANGLVVWALSIVVGVMIASSAISTAAKIATGIASNTAAAVVQVAEQSADQAFATTNANSTSATPVLTENERKRVVAALQRGLEEGQLTDRDRAYLENMLVRKTGVTPEQAKERFDEVVKPAAKQAATAVEDVRQATALTGFWSVFVMLLSGLAAWWAGAFGGSHRDELALDRDV